LITATKRCWRLSTCSGAVGCGGADAPWLELGVAANAGAAYVGKVGEAVVDFTALGDPVSVAARMQQRASGGELLVAAGVDDELAAQSSLRRLSFGGPAANRCVCAEGVKEPAGPAAVAPPNTCLVWDTHLWVAGRASNTA
jgi:adenylate cyclase